MPSVTIMTIIFNRDADCASPEAHCNPLPPSNLHIPSWGIGCSPLSPLVPIPRETSNSVCETYGISFKCILTFPLLWLFPWPKMVFSYPSPLFKIFLSLQGIFKCYHLYEVFPDRCANRQLEVFFPLPPNLPLQMPVISPMNASCLCLLWL